MYTAYVLIVNRFDLWPSRGQIVILRPLLYVNMGLNSLKKRSDLIFDTKEVTNIDFMLPNPPTYEANVNKVEIISETFPSSNHHSETTFIC